MQGISPRTQYKTKRDKTKGVTICNSAYVIESGVLTQTRKERRVLHD